MQRKALKQLNKVTQWTNEKVFAGEKTQFSSDFTDFEREIEPKQIGIERLHATSTPFFSQMTKVKQSADPYQPGGGKDKVLATEALGLVMIDYGADAGGEYGDGLTKYGRARCKLAVVQEEFGARLSEGYIAGMEEALAVVNDYKAMRKKLESRRLTLDATISRLKGSKRENPALEQEVETAQERFQEAEEETQARMEVIQQLEEQQFTALADLLDAELDYFTKCKDILDDLKSTFPSYSGSTTRPRAKSNASARSFTKSSARSYSRRDLAGSEDEAPAANRSRSASNASAGRGKDREGKDERRGMFSFGSFGKKAVQANVRDATKTFKKDGSKYGNLSDEERRGALTYETEDTEDDDGHATAPVRPTPGNRARSQSSVAKLGGTDGAPPMRRSATTPNIAPAARHVKALYDYAGAAGDELSFTAGDVIAVTSQVSDDWCIGELRGRSGLFPFAYTEEHVPTPTTAVPPGLPRRTLPPPAGGARRMPPAAAREPSLHESTDGDGDSYAAFSDDDIRQSVALSSSAQPAASSAAAANRARASSIKKPAPPPPPSRRSASSNNLSGTTGYLSPAPPAFQRTRSSTLSRSTTVDSSPDPGNGLSPFAGSEDEDSAAEDAGGGTGRPGAGTRSLGSGLGQLHLGGGAASQAAASCAACGCDDFTQNVFKAKGVCSTCFHQH